MTPIRFVMIGGFLGAGKTTTVARLARMYQAQGKKVGIVTNDQATDLVDTQSLRAQGFQVGEVAGACFCCNFNELTATVDRLAEADRPDVILSEPVGSCTDLVATVIRPLQQLLGAVFDIAPYGVILKPSHGLRILSGREQAGFSPKAEYIFRKQIEEADFIMLNRIDALPPAEIDELTALLKDQFADRPILRMSALTGAGFDELFEFLGQSGHFGRRLIDMDYDTYAEGEAELGWLNSSLTVSATDPFALDALLLGIVEQLRVRLQARGAETAHLKTIGIADGAHGVANLVSSWTPAELSLPSDGQVKEASVIVNARVAIDPVELEQDVRAAVDAAAAPLQATAVFGQTQSFRPGRPVPTHRLLEVNE
ncbi:GTP-binding protein [Lignipirellula cremea]|uniref:Metal chaperone YciC n=1 Tax=Lignipirellula cremea TaxID=2528010 RepID=A0A518DX30_9BACT|nr:GTP-binding protein [Lignipirellula cremea]QDU96374.1 Putative metal chaperone YciC [Lignipirellula cremea]